MKSHFPAWYKMCQTASILVDGKFWYKCSGYLGHNEVVQWRPEPDVKNTIRLKFVDAKEVTIDYNLFGAAH